MPELTEVLSQLDPENDEHWTGEGLPALDAVHKLGFKNPRRPDVTAASPGFNREAARAGKPEPKIVQQPFVMDDDAEQTGDGSPAGGLPGGIDPAALASPSHIPTVASPEPAPVVEQSTAAADFKANVEAAMSEMIANADDPVAKARELVEQAQAAMDAAAKGLKAAQEVADKAELERQAREGKRRTSDDISDYHQTQLKLRQEKAARLAVLKDNGLQLKDLTRLMGSTGLDAVLQRRGKQGHGSVPPSVRVPQMANVLPTKAEG